MHKLIFTILFFAIFSNIGAQNVEIVIVGLKNNKGKVGIGVFKNSFEFENEKTENIQTYDKKDVENGRMTISINLKPGIYGISLLDDENSDSKMNYNFIGIPNEGYGFANWYHTGFSRPVFDDFKLEIKENMKYKMVIKVRYLRF